VEGIAVAIFLALALRLALLLGATPVGNMTQEILYLRSDVFRPMVRIVVVFLLLEGADLLLAPLTDLGLVRAEWAATAGPILDLLQALLLVVLAASTLRAFTPYSRRSLAELEVVARRSVDAVARRLRARTPPALGPRRAR
jgi:hypothetical protein